MSPATNPSSPSAEDIREAIRVVEDPEIGISIVDLGLVYDITNDAGAVTVNMTLTTPFCPIGPSIQAQVDSVVRGLPGVRTATINFVWSPPWDPRTMASDEAKDILGIW